MEDRPRNYSVDIHNVTYLEEFDAKPLTHRTLIASPPDETELLNGLWHFTIDRYDRCLRDRWFEERSATDSGESIPIDYCFDTWEQVTVPSCWNLQREVYHYYEGCAVYTRRFRYLKRGEERVFLHFEGATGTARVFLNRAYAGTHHGGSTPFSVEITHTVSGDNRLLVVVDNAIAPHTVPPDHTDWFNYGGLYRDVRLIRVPATFIRDCFIHLVPGSGFRRIRAEVTVDGPESAGEGILRVPDLGVAVPFSVDDGRGVAEVEAVPELWSPDTPTLYDVEVSYAGHVVRDRVGFREMAVKGTDVLLNGVPIYLRGVSLHEDTVAGGKAVGQAELRDVFQAARDLGCNFLRLAHYPHGPRVARMADEQGMLLWEEIPVYWAIAFDRPETYADAENQLVELIRRDRNRASVALWSVGNETADTDARLRFMTSLVRTARSWDPTRPVTAACLLDKTRRRINDRLSDHLDVVGVNEYYGWYDPCIDDLAQVLANSRLDKPLIISEMGAGARAGHHGSRDELFTEEHQAEVYRRQLEILGAAPCVKGITPWILYDFRCPRRTNEHQDYYNRKGLLAEDLKRRKLAYHVLRDFYHGRRDGGAGNRAGDGNDT